MNAVRGEPSLLASKYDVLNVATQGGKASTGTELARLNGVLRFTALHTMARVSPVVVARYVSV
jgi:hypothetical protein